MKNSELIKEYTHRETFTKVELPSLYQILVHNDDFTPMDFVIKVLEKFLHMDKNRATQITYIAHIKGKAGCGTFTKDTAESKLTEIVDYITGMNEHPLLFSMEAV